MYITCLDVEGVLVPEIWIAFAEASGIPELKKTTRDEPDYDKLMKWRLGVLKEHGLGLKEIQDVIKTIDPLPGAKEFLDELRSFTQVILISDTFTQFASPLMEKLGWPTLFCNSLEVAEDGEITGFKMRVEQSKLTTVKALQSIGFDTIASGDSYNDLGMIQASKAGFLFRSTDKIKADYPDIPAYETYEELLSAIRKAMVDQRSGKKQHWKACVRCAVGTVTGYMDLRTGDEIKPIFDMDFGCDQRAYAGCRDPALWPQDKCSV